MRTRAAVLRGIGRDWEIEEITLDPPHAGEVLVRMEVAGLCHSDDHFATGDTIPDSNLTAAMEASGIPVPVWFPLLGGHEGAGVVEEVGEGVTALKPGDRVATSFTPACGSCRWCVNGQSFICDSGAHLFSTAMVTDFTCRRHLGDTDLMAAMQLGTFADHIVASERSLIKIGANTPFDAGSLLSCGVTTGFGTATVSGDVQPGDVVVVIGVGGVGMNAVQGARIAGARVIVAVDPVESKQESAKDFGATHTVGHAYEAVDLVRQLSDGVMADRVLVTAGVVHTDLIPVAMMLTRKGGICVVTGVTPLAEMNVPLILSDMVNYAKTLKGALYGEMNPRAAIPHLLKLYESGQLKLDELVTRRYRLEDINDAVADLRAGKNIRGVIDLSAG